MTWAEWVVEICNVGLMVIWLALVLIAAACLAGGLLMVLHG